MMRERVFGPPVGFRPSMPKQVKLEACLIALGIDPKAAAFDHQPAIQERTWDADAGDTRPRANDPHFIVPLGKALHQEKTAKRDIPEIAKTKRLTRKNEEAVARMLAKAPGQERPRSRWASRPMRRAGRTP